MARLKIRKFQFPLWAMLALVTFCAICIAVNWQPILFRWKYGTPVDLKSVTFVGINDDSMMLDIDGNRITTQSSTTLNRIIFGLATAGEADLEDSLRIRGVWQKGSDPPTYTIRIGDELVPSR